MNNDERRSEERINSSLLKLVAFDSINNKQIGSITNISTHGLMLLSNIEAEVQGVLQISVREAESSEASSLFDAAIKIGWRSTASTPENCWLGVQIIGITENHQAVLDDLVLQAEQL